MIIVPYLLSEGGEIEVEQARARIVEDTDIIPAMVEYSLVPTYRITLTRVQDEEKEVCFRCHLDRVPLEENQVFPPFAIQYDLYQRDVDSVRSRFLKPDIEDSKLETSFGLREPIAEDQSKLPNQRFTRITILNTKPGQKSILLGTYRIIGIWPNDFFVLASAILSNGKYGSSIVIYNGVVELQHKDLGTLTYLTSKTGQRITEDPSEEELWKLQDEYFESKNELPRFRILKTGRVNASSTS